MRIHRPAKLALALLAGLAAAGGVVAQSAAPTPAQQKELDAARAELDGAAKRYAELARNYHVADAPMRLEQRIVRKPVLGVLLAPDPAAGVRIAGVTPESGASKAGLRSGDRITAINGKALGADEADTRLDDARALLRNLDTETPVRVAYAREGRDAVASVSPQLDQRVFMFNGTDGSLSRFGGPVTIMRGKDGAMDVTADSIEIDAEEMREGMERAMGALSTEMPRIQTEILRLGNCKDGEKCRFPMLTEAFRWSGLNLASLDPQLGRYFGTNAGVLVLSTGDDLDGLQPGDVVQKIDGQSVSNPREAMAALRAKPAGSQVRVDYLRDRKPVTAQVDVPEATPFRVPAPPAPPAPPPPPRASGAPAPPAPPPALSAMNAPAPPAAPAPPQLATKRKIVFVDENGKTRTWEGDANAPMPSWTPKHAGESERIERRKIVKVDENGKTLTWEGDADDPLPEWADDMPPPPEPPAPPPPPPAPGRD